MLSGNASVTSSEQLDIWDGVYSSFTAATVDACGPGFDGEVYLVRTINSARECLAALSNQKPIPGFHKQRTTVLPPVTAMILQKQRRVRILDFGGALGIGYMALLESLPEAAHRVEYTVLENSGICKAGRDLFPEGGQMFFVESLPQHLSYDLVYSSSALQYLDDWQKGIRDVSHYRAPYLLLSDVFAGTIPTYVTLQNYYGSRIRHWFLNIDELLQCLAANGYELIMKSHVTSRRLHSYDQLPMKNFPASHRLTQTLHLLLQRTA